MPAGKLIQNASMNEEFAGSTTSPKHHQAVYKSNCLETLTEPSNLTFRLVVLIDVDNMSLNIRFFSEQPMQLLLIDPLWIMVEDTSTPRICVELSVSEGDYVNLSIQNPFWSFENETSLAEDTHVLCLRGQVGAIQSLPQRDDQHLVIGPPITLHREEPIRRDSSNVNREYFS